MEDNKYYTPTIDEFHVGFEYEAFINNSWQSKVMNDYEDIIYFLFDMNAKTWLSINEGIVRVKYLDKEDIESLGFDCTSDDQYYLIDNYTLLIDNDYFLQILKDDFEEDIYLFQGTIKNKSELKVLLKQLGIEYGRGN